MDPAIAASRHSARPALRRRHRRGRCRRARGGGGGGGGAIWPRVHERHAVDLLGVRPIHAARRPPRAADASAVATAAATAATAATVATAATHAATRGRIVGVPHTQAAVAAHARTERAVGREREPGDWTPVRLRLGEQRTWVGFGCGCGFGFGVGVGVGVEAGVGVAVGKGIGVDVGLGSGSE